MLWPPARGVSNLYKLLSDPEQVHCTATFVALTGLLGQSKRYSELEGLATRFPQVLDEAEGAF